MKYIARRFRMKSGEYCVLRSPEPGDAAQRVSFLRQVNGETDFMARGSEDSPADIDLVADMLYDQLEDELTLEIAAFAGDEMIACGGISPATRAYPRKRHRASFGICVKKAHWGQGIAGAILNALADEAGKMGYGQIELTVVDDNLRARRLYEKCGFRETGRVPDALRYEDGSCRDEIMMIRQIKTKTLPM